MNALSQAERDRLARVLALLGSDHPGERDSAGMAAYRLVHRAGLSWNQVLNPPPPDHPLPELGTWRRTCATLAARSGDLRAWERGFVADLPKFRRLSTKQRYVLDEISKRVLGVREGAR